ncbi:MAG: YggT family protein [Moraxellaceae bacterium]|nr:MAG: YggT family protein [Moraxellaceae bacterium]
MQTLAQIAIYVISSLGTLYVSLVLLRFLLQLFRADYYNPISKAIAKLTNPLLLPLRKIIPGLFGIDLAAIVLALLLQALLMQIIFFLHGFGLQNIFFLLIWSLIALVGLLLAFYYWGVLIMIIASLVAPYSDNPALTLLRQITEPVLAPFRKIIPPIGGLDLSPILFFMILQICRSYLLPALAQTFGMPAGLAIGV